MLDLDHFKDFNDDHGHQAGDDHLRAVAVSWQGRLRATDLVARYGGEEFALILSGTTLAQAVEVIETLRAAVPSEQTVSGGVAEWDGSESGAELLARADRALYEAKRSGRNRTVSLAAKPAQRPAIDQAADLADLEGAQHVGQALHQRPDAGEDQQRVLLLDLELAAGPEGEDHHQDPGDEARPTRPRSRPAPRTPR